VGTIKATTKPEYKVEIIEFQPSSDSFDIVIQVANFTYSRGGIWYAPELGTIEDVNYSNIGTKYRDLFLIGCFFVMILHSLFIYLLRRSEKSYYYFAMMCITIIIRISVYSSYLITYIKPLNDLNIIVRLDYLCLAWMNLGFIMMSYWQFPGIIPEKAKKIIYIFSITYSALVLVTPIHIFTRFIYIMEVVCLITAGITLVRIYKAYKRGYNYAILLIITSIFFFICAIHDLLLQNNFILGNAIEYFPIGFFVFMLCEDFVLDLKYTKTMKENELALIQIEEINNKIREAELKFLKSQIKPHFIHNALNTIIAISKKDSERSRDLLYEFSNYLRCCFDFENLDYAVSIDREIEFIYSYLNIEKARFGNSLEIEYDIDLVSIVIPPLLLQPLVENAIQHGIRKRTKGGKILVYVKKREGFVTIGVQDDGIGISLDKVKDILSGKDINHEVGLFNINQRINKRYHISLVIENIEAGGTNVYMNIPLE